MKRIGITTSIGLKVAVLFLLFEVAISFFLAENVYANTKLCVDSVVYNFRDGDEVLRRISYQESNNTFAPTGDTGSSIVLERRPDLSLVPQEITIDVVLMNPTEYPGEPFLENTGYWFSVAHGTQWNRNRIESGDCQQGSSSCRKSFSVNVEDTDRYMARLESYTANFLSLTGSDNIQSLSTCTSDIPVNDIEFPNVRASDLEVNTGNYFPAYCSEVVQAQGSTDTSQYFQYVNDGTWGRSYPCSGNFIDDPAVRVSESGINLYYNDGLLSSSDVYCFRCLSSEEQSRYILGYANACGNSSPDNDLCLPDQGYACRSSSLGIGEVNLCRYPSYTRNVGSTCISSGNECVLNLAGAGSFLPDPVYCAQDDTQKVSSMSSSGSYTQVYLGTCTPTPSCTENTECVSLLGDNARCLNLTILGMSTHRCVSAEWINNCGIENYCSWIPDTVRQEVNQSANSSTSSSDSTSYGVKNCPDDEEEACAACMGYVKSGNDWVLDASASKGTWTAIGCINTTPEGIFVTLVRITLGVMGGVALLRLIYMGYLYQTGDEGKIKQAREGVVSTLVGIIVVVFSVVILRIIGVNVLDVVPSGFYGG